MRENVPDFGLICDVPGSLVGNLSRPPLSSMNSAQSPFVVSQLAAFPGKWASPCVTLGRKAFRVCGVCLCEARALCWRHTGLLGRSEYVVDGLLWGTVGAAIQPSHIKHQIQYLFYFTSAHALYVLMAVSVHAVAFDWTTVVTLFYECLCPVYCVSLDDAYTCHTAHVTNTFSIWRHTSTFSNQALYSLLPWWFVFVLTCLELLWLGLIKEGRIIKLSVTKQGSSVSDIAWGANLPPLRLIFPIHENCFNMMN